MVRNLKKLNTQTWLWTIYAHQWFDIWLVGPKREFMDILIFLFNFFEKILGLMVHCLVLMHSADVGVMHLGHFLK